MHSSAHEENCTGSTAKKHSGILEKAATFGRAHYYLTFTACFLVFACAAFGYLFATGHSLIWNDDGLDQHFTFFTYIGEWLRQIVSTGTVPMWDFTMGYGSDVICTLASWLGEPFNLLSALCPPAYSEYLYQALVVVRLYLAGIAFSAFCRYHKRNGFGTLLGALAYSLCGFCLVWGAFRHPMFIDAAILLPFVLLGADKVFAGKRPTTFLIAITLTFITYFYFAYMICLFLLLFCLMRYFMGERERSVTDFFKLAGKLLAYVLIGAAISAVILLPIVMYVLHMGRLEAGVEVPLFRELGVYLLYPLTMEGGDSSSRGMAFQSVAVLCLLAAFLASPLRKDKRLQQPKVAFIVLTVFALVPFFGHVLNGFSYVTDRWMFAYAMAACSIISLTAPRLSELGKTDWKKILVATVFLELWMAALLIPWFNRRWIIVVMILTAATTFTVWIAAKRCHTNSNQQNCAPLGLYLVILVALLVNIGAFSTMHLTSKESASDSKPYIESMTKRGAAYATQTSNSANRMVLDMQENNDEPFRYDKATEITRRNSSTLQGLYSIDFYSSVYSQPVDDFRTQMALSFNSDLQSHQIYNSDSRAALEALSGVRYFLIPDGAEKTLPYGYNEKVSTDTLNDKEYSLYTSRSTLPMAFTYKSALSTEEFEALSPLERQEALLQGCAVDDTGMAPTELHTTSSEAACSINLDDSTASLQTGDGVEVASGSVDISALDNGRVICTNDNATLTLNFTGTPHAETYLYLDTLDLQDYTPSEGLSEEELANLSFAERVKLFIADGNHGKVKSYKLTFKNDAIATKTMRGDTRYGNFYTGKHTWLVNLGYTEETLTSVTITFNRAGEYSLNDLQVLCQPMGNFDDQVAALNEEPVENLKLDTNRITGSVELAEDRLVYLSVPYSEGWTATIDGQETPVLCANTAFMALEMPAGSHEFELRYEAPYLHLGMAISAAGIIAFVVVVWFTSRSRRNDS